MVSGNECLMRLVDVACGWVVLRNECRVRGRGAQCVIS